MSIIISAVGVGLRIWAAGYLIGELLGLVFRDSRN